jgi:hypothetical protein
LHSHGSKFEYPNTEFRVMSTPSYQFYAGGQWHAAEGNAQFDVLQPYDRAVFARVPAGEVKKFEAAQSSRVRHPDGRTARPEAPQGLQPP